MAYYVINYSKLRIWEFVEYSKMIYLDGDIQVFDNIDHLPIPPIYNLVMAMLWRHPENIELDKAKVVHYCAAGSKPWRYIGKEDNMDREVIKTLVAKWWEIYDDESLDYNNVVASGQAAEANEDKQSGLQLFLAALSKAGGFVRRINAPSAA
ncbi:Glycogenin-1 [Gossypium arboreum]|uniref:Hexosyltransferase n=1 Tax=Gossypium arboreum TaxID=29729 RepID=A0A0B0NNV7_GOSAR|nr:Glycogenin-1 [Gossypium arboreum]KHG17085.1 Glycogenin-1 [Gossypium arboreum]KHG26813.1 Glycogenin-1 [Gossypium arboreum]